MTDAGTSAGHIDTGKPHSARMYDYYLGGKDNYPVDAEAAEQVISLFPAAREMARTNRLFMHRASRLLAGRGVRQFLDIGTGIPTEPNLHQIVQEIVPRARVVYADNDPIVLRHAQALLHSAPEGKTAYVHGDVREPGKIIEAARETLDFSRPIALSLVALLHLVADEDEPARIVRELLEPLPAGSYLTLSHATGDFDPETWERVVEVYRKGGTAAQVRSHAEFSAFFTGLELVEPGVVLAARWHPELGEQTGGGGGGEETPLYVAVGRKP
ncbi:MULTISPECIES: SAM-dependent methyltransferase [Streptomyces]|uniref:S-adenosyl methyltransferase n=1 Tax=Streptomyces chartreusis NRRL 3882 TaxID=1079985 RepID=A0A2N9B564_STRCX|nr:SAM-dependent methyltransferase [Streptomyces chartreusis]SOR78469.1 S-adenosyl methyltransferase [Streptomyces chartreusis NRRL 3882]